MLTLTADAVSDSRDEIRQKWQNLKPTNQGELFVSSSSSAHPYTSGVISSTAITDGINAANFMRYLANLNELELSETLSDDASICAVLLVETGKLDHHPPQPIDMPKDYYDVGLITANTSNLFWSNYMDNTIFFTAIDMFMRDSDDFNLPKLGHRRWLLNPHLYYTGFGFAPDHKNGCYLVMPIYDTSQLDVTFDYVAWPSSGLFPSDVFSADEAWSFSPNLNTFILNDADIIVTLTRKNDDTTWVFSDSDPTPSKKFFYVNMGNYGSGGCIIFRPDKINDYYQNDIYTVQIDGLLDRKTLKPIQINYSVEFMSLEPLELTNIEVDESLYLFVGEKHQMNVSPIPSWADDVELFFESSDINIAITDHFGVITGISRGKCMITVTSDGLSANCEVIVK